MWSKPIAALWDGISKAASLDSIGKEQVQFKEVLDFLHTADESISGKRNKAMVAVSFFGVRRSAETPAFNMPDGVALFVSCQKTIKGGSG